MADFSDLGDADTAIIVGVSDGEQFASMQPDAESSRVGLGLSDADRLMSMQVFDAPQLQDETYGSRIVQRVYDAAAQRWCYFEADAPNPAPAMADTTPAHSGSIRSHEVLYGVEVRYLDPGPRNPGV